MKIINGADQFSIGEQAPTQNWSIQIGAFTDAHSAKMANAALVSTAELGLNTDNGFINPVPQGQKTLYRARFGGLQFEHAQNVCRFLMAQERACHVIAP